VHHSLDRELAALAARQHGIFTLGDARALGLSEGRIEARVGATWQSVHETVFRIAGAPRTWKSEFYAATRAATPPVAISFRSGAALYELPTGRTNVTELNCRRWKRSRKPGLVVHESTRFSEVDITVVDGIQVVTAERLIMELAGLRPYPDHVEKLIQAARRKRLITYDSTIETFERLRRRGLPGVRAMAAALDRWNPESRATHSDPETRLVQILRNHGLPEPVTQFPVLDQYGNLVATTDAALPQWKITIEYQSTQEHTDEFQAARDDARRNEILAAGYFPIAARPDDLRKGGHRLVDQIRRTAQRAAS
jgi:hypothetical protein